MTRPVPDCGADSAPIFLWPDHRPTAPDGAGTATAGFTLAGAEASSWHALCKAASVAVAPAVLQLAHQLSYAWSQFEDPAPGLTLQAALVAAGPPPPGSPVTLSARALPGPAVTVSACWQNADFLSPTVAAFLGALERLMIETAADPDTEFASVAQMTAAARREVLHLGSGGRPTIAGYLSVAATILKWAQHQPDRPALRWAGRTVSYSELVLRARAVEAQLAAVGVGPGDHVLLYGEQSDLTVVAMLAAHLRGAAYVPLDPGWPADRLDRVLTETAATACLIATDEGHAANHVAARLPTTTPGIEVRRGTILTGEGGPGPAADAIAYVLFTSGTTGVPKGISISQASLSHMCRETVSAYGIHENDRVLAFARPVFDVSVFEVFATLSCGAQVVIPDADTRLDPYLLTEFVRAESVTVVDLPPALLPLLDPAELDSVRLVIVGGEALPGALVEAWSGYGRELWNAYGPTESTVTATVQRLAGQWAGPPPIGRPIAGSNAYVVDPALRLRPRGAAGELCLAGPSLAVGYLNDPARTAAGFVELPEVAGVRAYRTGDLVRWRGDGALDYLGRLDRQVKVNGFRVELAEVEGALMSMAGIRQAVVELVDAPGGGSRLSALVVGPGAARPEAVLTAVRRVLPDYAVPTWLVAAEAIPVTANGKIDRLAVAALVRGAEVVCGD